MPYSPPSNHRLGLIRNSNEGTGWMVLRALGKRKGRETFSYGASDRPRLRLFVCYWKGRSKSFLAKGGRVDYWYGLFRMEAIEAPISESFHKGFHGPWCGVKKESVDCLLEFWGVMRWSLVIRLSGMNLRSRWSLPILTSDFFCLCDRDVIVSSYILLRLGFSYFLTLVRYRAGPDLDPPFWSAPRRRDVNLGN